MQAVILAAGMGKRLKELTQDNTKCMLRVNGVRLIERMLGQLLKLGVKRTILVIGYKGENVKKLIGRTYRGMPIKYITNPIYDKTNNIYSLALASDELCKDDTILLESDIILEDSILNKVAKSEYPNIACVDAWQPWMDGTVVTLDRHNLIKKFIPKREFEYESAKEYYKTVNVYKFSKEFSKNDYVPFLKAYSQSLGNNEYYEQVLRVIALLDKPLVYGLPLDGDRWYEIDDEQDLDIAESMFCEAEMQAQKLAQRYGGYWRYPGMLDFCYLVTPYFPTQRLRDELKNSFDTLLESYPSGQRINSLVAAKTFGVRHQYVAVGNGAAELIKICIENEQGNIGFVYPTFEEYPNRLPELRRCIFTPSASEGFRYSAKDVIAYFGDKKLSLLVIINPDNPSGNLMARQDVNKLIRWASRKRIRLIVDESFMDFADEPFSLMDNRVLERYQHLIVVKSISKSYGVPGLRLGVIASGDEGYISDVRRQLPIWNINSFGEYFLQIAEKYKADYKEGCACLSSERKKFISKLRDLSFLTVYDSAANYVLCEVRPPVTPNKLVIGLLKKHRILIKDCSSKKGFAGRPFVRIAIRSAADNDRLIEALKDFGI